MQASPVGLLTLWHNEEPDVDSVLVQVESYTDPGQWQRVNLDSGDRTVVRRRELPNYASDDYVMEVRWVTARDGEPIPVKIARHVDTPLDGTAPVLLYGYGAYESSFWPGFDGSLPSLLDRGVVFVHALIRGGGEMGRRWYLGGSMLTKRNTFTDFIDVADALASDGVIDGSRIVSRGLSAGGLLQGAVYSMRPDRWRAVVAEVPFVDVVTSMLDHDIPLTANEVDEWGDPRIEDQFDYMLSYSPYENVPSEGRPELLATGALHDPRVLIHEPAKWVARIRETAQPGDAANALSRRARRGRPQRADGSVRAPRVRGRGSCVHPERRGQSDHLTPVRPPRGWAGCSPRRGTVVHAASSTAPWAHVRRRPALRTRDPRG